MIASNTNRNHHERILLVKKKRQKRPIKNRYQKKTHLHFQSKDGASSTLPLHLDVGDDVNFDLGHNLRTTATVVVKKVLKL